MKISDAELASFLRQLANLYKSSAIGNPSLSDGLKELASFVSKRGVVSDGENKKRSAEKEGNARGVDFSYLKSLKTDEVEKFISDERRTKLELVELANIKFSIPRSQLSRMRMPEVRQAIRSALLYEDSIDIISSEAKRGGVGRRS